MNIQTSRAGNWMQTASGGIFWPLDPRPDEILIEDIAASLSKMCRYAGHCTRFYSVAEHSVLVSQYVDDEFALWGLLHDATEAYLVDIPRPIKPYLTNYKDIEYSLMSVIADRFGLKGHIPPEVKRIDNAILVDEQRHIMKPAPKSWDLTEPPIGLTRIEGWYPDVAEYNFLQRFEYLTNRL